VGKESVKLTKLWSVLTRNEIDSPIERFYNEVDRSCKRKVSRDEVSD